MVTYDVVKKNIKTQKEFSIKCHIAFIVTEYKDENNAAGETFNLL